MMKYPVKQNLIRRIEYTDAAPVRCPECAKGKTRQVVREHQHCTGAWNERIEYECGFALAYTPNFRTSKVSGECKWSAAARAKEEVRREQLDHIDGYLRCAIEDATDREDSVFAERLGRVMREVEWLKRL